MQILLGKIIIGKFFDSATLCRCLPVVELRSSNSPGTGVLIASIYHALQEMQALAEYTEERMVRDDAQRCQRVILYSL